MRKIILFALVVTFFQFFLVAGSLTQETPKKLNPLVEDARQALRRGIAFYRSISIQGGYVFHYTLDLKEKWGEGRTDDQTIEVQPPGTPAVGLSFLRAYRVMREPAFLHAAEEAGRALIKGQNELGGWEHRISFDRPLGRTVSFDDDQTQSALRFLMELDGEIDSDSLATAIDRGLKMMVASQLEHGGWPHQYPKQGNYHDFATFNDGGINDCISVMLQAERSYGKPAYRESLKKAGWFLIQSQLPPPQPGWAQQYNQYLQPAWARAFEPPSVCPQVTIRNIHTLIDLFLHINDRRYLEPIPDALAWLREIRMPNGKWARFVEIGTGKPLYYDRGRIRVDSVDQLSLERRTGYRYEQDLSKDLEEVSKRFAEVSGLDRESVGGYAGRFSEKAQVEERIKALRGLAQEVVRSQDDHGRWVVRNDRYRQRVAGEAWNGVYETSDRISSARFNENVALLCEFLELVGRTN